MTDIAVIHHSGYGHTKHPTRWGSRFGLVETGGEGGFFA
jgi:hypothetical protein